MNTRGRVAGDVEHVSWSIEDWRRLVADLRPEEDKVSKYAPEMIL